MTEWRPVVGYEGRYEVSDDGQVRSFGPATGQHGGGARGQRLLKFWPHRKAGYPMVTLYRAGQPRVSRTVHSLVLAAFVGPRPPGLQTRHLNGVATDCRLTNLVYGTQSENEADKVRHGRR
jgi:hypothetical protein